MNRLSGIGQNGIEEFFEEITFTVANDAGSDYVKDITKNMDDGIVKEALESSLMVVKMGVIMYLISKQEDFLEGLIKKSSAIIVLLVSYPKDFLSKKLKGKKGLIFSKLLKFMQSDRSDRIQIAQVVTDQVGNLVSSKDTSNSSANNLSNSISVKDHLINKDRLNLEITNSKLNNFNQTALLKLFSSNFTENDKFLLKKMTGKSNINIEDMNKVSEFMFVKDKNGNLTGLSDSFMQLVNGLGYLKK